MRDLSTDLVCREQDGVTASPRGKRVLAEIVARTESSLPSMRPLGCGLTSETACGVVLCRTTVCSAGLRKTSDYSGG